MPENHSTDLHDSPEPADASWSSAIYAELRRLAAHKLARESPDSTLQPTALVHEAYLRLVGDRDVSWDSRAHFFGAAAEAMRRILIDHARARQRIKRNRHQRKEVELESITESLDAELEELLALDEALEKFRLIEPRKAKLVQLKFYGGLTIAEASELLRISTRTGERDWAFARAWLYQEMQSHES